MGTVTVKESVFEVVDVVWSVANTLYIPGVSEGTRKVQVNVPAPLVVMVVLDGEPLPMEHDWGANSVLPNWTVAPALEVNPLAVTTNGVDTGPCTGVIPMSSVVTVNADVADCPPTSVARTVVPEVPDGTLKVQLNDPVALAIIEPEVHEDIVIPSNVRPAIPVETENPVPAIVTGEPIGP